MSQAAPLQALGKFHLIAELGHGGMADVFLAVAQGPAGFSKLQVLKQLRPSLAENPEVLAMFLDEARLAARLNHPNVVQTYEVEQDGSACYLAMEYLEGQPLDRILRRSKKQGGIPLPLHLRILCDTLAGLHHAHELQDFDGTPLRVVHRDVSPQNIFVTYEGQIKVVDFGIAKAANGSAETRTGVLKGKIAYMSPEQALGDDLDRRSDLFAVGILLFEAVSGQKFWGAATDIQILHRLSSNTLPSADVLPPSTPDHLRRICARALAHRAEDRYANAIEFRDDLEKYMHASASASGRDVGVYVASLFDDRRKQARTVIEEQLKVLRSQGDLSPQRPNLFSQTMTMSAPRAGDLVSSPNATPFASEAPDSPSPAAPRALWPIAALGIGAALLGALGLRVWTSAPTAPSTVASAPAAPQPVELRVSASPPEARVFLDGALLPGNPCSGRFPRDGASHRVRVEAPGYAPLTQLVSFDDNRSLDVSLTPEPKSEDKKPDDKGPEPRKAAARPGAPFVPVAPATTAAGSPDDLPNPPSKKPLRAIDKDDPWKLPPLPGASGRYLRARISKNRRGRPAH